MQSVMNTTIEIIDNLPIGSVVPKIILARMKRAGVIDSYSRKWGYLDGHLSDMHRLGIIEYKGRYFKKKYLDGCFYPYLIKANVVPQKRMDYMQFKGDFDKVVSSDMLVANAWNLHYKVNGVDWNKFYQYYQNKQKVIGERIYARVHKDISEPRMCMWGAIV